MGSLLCKSRDRAWSHLDSMQESDTDACGSYRDHLRLHLSNGEIKIIQSMWDQLKQMHDGNVGARVFCELFAQKPELKRMFGLGGTTSLEGAITHPRMVKHTLVFQDTLELVVRTLSSENEQLSSLLIAFGSQHAYFLRRHFDPKYWTLFGEVLTDLVNDLPVKTYRRKKMSRLWFRLMYFIVASVRTGHTIGGTSKFLTSSSRRWWKDVRRRHSAVENQLIDVLYVTDPVKI